MYVHVHVYCHDCCTVAILNAMNITVMYTCTSVFIYREKCIEIFFYQFYALLKADPHNVSLLSGKVSIYIIYAYVQSRSLATVSCGVTVESASGL